jgi:uncharacterized protein (TIGR03067 family)
MIDCRRRSENAMTLKRSWMLPVGMLLVASLAGCGQREPKPVEDKKPDDLEKLQGKWKVIKVEVGGKSVQELTGEMFTIEDNKYINHKTKRVYTFKTDATKKPGIIDLYVKDRRTAVGIYMLEGDTVTFCFREGDKRPKEFKSTPGIETTMYTGKREKKLRD